MSNTSDDDDPVQQMIDMLAMVSGDVLDLKRAMDGKAPGVESVQKIEAALAELRRDLNRASPGAVAQAATNGAKAIASDLQLATSALRAALPQVEAAEDRRWWLWAAVALAVVLGHLAAFTGGMVYIRSGLALNTEFGCRYLGGQWSITKDGAVCAHWR